MIVKIQIPIITTEENPRALAYNIDRKYEGMIPITDKLLRMMNGRPKAFFHAKLKNDELNIEMNAPWQDW